jgi:hypothetical protein
MLLPITADQLDEIAAGPGTWTETERVLAGQLIGAHHAIGLLLNALATAAACKGCGAPIWWLRHKNGRLAPYTAAGINHFIDCPNAAEFRAKRAQP